MTQGDCAVSDGGRCFTSPNYPYNYGDQQSCSIQVGTDVSLVVQSFAAAYGDWLSVNSHHSLHSYTPEVLYFRGSGEGLNGLTVGAGDVIDWSSDWNLNDAGFSICGLQFPSPPPSSPPPPPSPPGAPSQPPMYSNVGSLTHGEPDAPFGRKSM